MFSDPTFRVDSNQIQSDSITDFGAKCGGFQYDTSNYLPFSFLYFYLSLFDLILLVKFFNQLKSAPF